MLVRCFKGVQEMVINGYERGFDVAQSSDTAANVLEHHFSSSESENNTFITANSRLDNDGKKRNGIGHCKNPTVQISQIQQCDLSFSLSPSGW